MEHLCIRSVQPPTPRRRPLVRTILPFPIPDLLELERFGSVGLGELQYDGATVTSITLMKDTPNSFILQVGCFVDDENGGGITHGVRSCVVFTDHIIEIGRDYIVLDVMPTPGPAPAQ